MTASNSDSNAVPPTRTASIAASHSGLVTAPTGDGAAARASGIGWERKWRSDAAVQNAAVR